MSASAASAASRPPAASTANSRALAQGRPQFASLLALLLVYLVLGALYATSTPLLDISDEPRHYAMIERLADGAGLAIQDPATLGDPNDPHNPLQEGSQPPLYYAAMAVVAQLFDRTDFDQVVAFNPHAQLGRADTTHNYNQMLHSDAESFPWHGTMLAVMVMRLIGVGLGAIGVLGTYVTAFYVCRARGLSAQALPLGAAALTAFNPMYLHIMGSVNNDTLAVALASLALAGGVRALWHGVNWRNGLAMGALMGGAALTKSSGLALGLVLPLCLLANELRLKAPLRRVILVALALGLPILAIAGWWYVRNWQLYGDLTGTLRMAQIAGLRASPPSLLQLFGEFGGFRKAFWGLFGALNIVMPEPVYVAFDAVSIVAAIGLAGMFFGWLRPVIGRVQPLIDESSLTAAMTNGVVLVTAAALISWTSLTLASQGRLMFPVIAAISSLTTVGCVQALQLWKRPEQPFAMYTGRTTTLIGMLLLLALAVTAPFMWLRPAYAEPKRLANDTTVPKNVEQIFGGDIRWIGYSVDKTRYSGGTLGLTLYWQGLRPMTVNHSAFINLYASGNFTVTHIDTYPGRGLYQTSRWKPGEVVVDRYELRPRDASSVPTVLTLDAGFFDYAGEGRPLVFLATTQPDGTPTSRQRYSIAAIGHTEQVNPDASLFVFERANVVAASASSQSQTLQLDIKWQATSDFDQDYTVFRQLWSADGAKKIEGVGGDGPPMNGQFPTLWWRKGDVINDRMIFDRQAVPPGKYSVHFGLYRQLPDGSFVNMPARSPKGDPLANNAASVDIVIP